MNFTHCLCGLPVHVCQGAQVDMHTWRGTNLHCRLLSLNNIEDLPALMGTHFICLGTNILCLVSPCSFALICITTNTFKMMLKAGNAQKCKGLLSCMQGLTARNLGLFLNADRLRVISNSPAFPWPLFHGACYQEYKNRGKQAERQTVETTDRISSINLTYSSSIKVEFLS